jgi:MFS family permease
MEDAVPRNTERPLVLASIMLAMFMVAIEATIVATAMPHIVAKLGGFSLYSWVFAAFMLTQAATVVIFGKLSDLYGRRPVLIGGIIVFLIGSALCGFAWSMPSLILFRLLQGLGAGSIQPVAMTIVGDLYSPQERASIQGYLSSVWGISAIVGPLVGAVIVERFSWPWVFWLNLPIGVLTIMGLTRFLHEGVEHKKHSIDYFGATLFALAISALLVCLTPQKSAVIPVVSGVFFVVAVPVFLWHERRTPEPMLDLELWTHRLVASANGAGMAAGMTFIGLTTFLAIYVQGVMGRSATVAGLALTMMAVGWPVASLLARPLYDRLGMRQTLRWGSALMIGGIVPLIMLTPTSSPVLAGFGSLVIGFGMGLLVTTSVILIQGSVAWAKRGSATASNVFTRILGSTLGAAVLGSLVNYGLQTSGTGPSGGVSPDEIRRLLGEGTGAAGHQQLMAGLDQALHLAFWGMLVLSVITWALALLVPDRNLHELGGATPTD